MANVGYNSVKGLPFNSLEAVLLHGTTAGTAGDALVVRPESPFHALPVAAHLEGKDVYIEDQYVLSEGFNFRAEEVIEAGASTQLDIITLDDDTIVAAFSDGGDSNKLKCIAGTWIKATSSYIWGTATVANSVASNSVKLTRVDDDNFVISYRDDGGSDYLCAKVGAVSGTTITFGDETELTAAAINDVGGAACLVRTGIVAFGYVANADSKLYCLASTIDTDESTVGTPGSAVEIEAGAVKELGMCSYNTGYVAFVFQDDGATNDPITWCGATVSAAKVVAKGTAASLAGTAAAATSCQVVSPTTNVLVFSWIDSTKPHVRAGTVSTTTLTAGTELELESDAHLTPHMCVLNDSKIAVVTEDDAHASDVGNLYTVTRSGTTLTKSKTNQFTAAAVITPKICATEADRVHIFFNDAGNSNKGTIIPGHWSNHIIDVRAGGASAEAKIWVVPCPGRRRKA